MILILLLYTMLFLLLCFTVKIEMELKKSYYKQNVGINLHLNNGVVVRIPADNVLVGTENNADVIISADIEIEFLITLDENGYKIKNMASELFVERYGKLFDVNETVSLENNDKLTFFGYNGDDSISISMTVKMEWEKKNKIRNEVI